MFDRNSDTTILAPHGGKIESGTSEIARAIAGREFNLYCFEGIKQRRNYRLLHIASNNFDEPRCIRLLSRSRNVIAIHGCRGFRKAIFVGGRNRILRSALALKLQEAGMSARADDHPFLGEGEENVCNRGIDGEGVQFELTSGLRRSSDITRFIETVRGTLMLRNAILS